MITHNEHLNSLVNTVIRAHFSIFKKGKGKPSPSHASCAPHVSPRTKQKVAHKYPKQQVALHIKTRQKWLRRTHSPYNEF